MGNVIKPKSTIVCVELGSVVFTNGQFNSKGCLNITSTTTRTFNCDFPLLVAFVIGYEDMYNTSAGKDNANGVQFIAPDRNGFTWYRDGTNLFYLNAPLDGSEFSVQYCGSTTTPWNFYKNFRFVGLCSN